MIRGWSCWECGTTWSHANFRGLYVKTVKGNDPSCRHPDIHAVPRFDRQLMWVIS